VMDRNKAVFPNYARDLIFSKVAIGIESKRCIYLVSTSNSFNCMVIP
jgi:hypothetical protein